MLKGFWGDEPFVELKEATVHKQETEDQKKRDQDMIDDVVEELAKMELSQREKKGDDEGFEQLSEHWLKFKIWKVEQEWAAAKFIEAQKFHGMSGADASRHRGDAQSF